MSYSFLGGLLWHPVLDPMTKTNNRLKTTPYRYGFDCFCTLFLYPPIISIHAIFDTLIQSQLNEYQTK